jgi:hypothetical protein
LKSPNQMKRVVLILFILGSLHTLASNENEISNDHVQTVLLSRTGGIYNPSPIFPLSGEYKLNLMFDYMLPENQFFQYTFYHCDANWEQTDLEQNEYLDGNFVNEISDFKFSTNTLQKYVNYNLTFPNDEIKFTKSGNYVLKVFTNFNQEELVLVRRFMIVDYKTKVVATAQGATNPKDRFYKHEIDFEVDYKDFIIPNPFTDVKAVILQNNSWMNAVTNLNPLFVNNNKLSFNYEDKNLFDAGSEFRFFDIRTLRFFSNNVRKKFIDTLTNVVLNPDELKGHLTYLRQIDYNGKRVVQNTDGRNVAEEGDYAIVHFFLKAGNEIKNRDVYIYGELSDWRIQEDFKMTFIPEKSGYYKSVKLKQSYYNYQFVTFDEETKKLEYDFTEGNHFQTENDYTVLIYHRNQMFDYDELIGMAETSSGQ